MLLNDSGHFEVRRSVPESIADEQRPVVTANAARLVPQKTMDPTKLIENFSGRDKSVFASS